MSVVRDKVSVGLDGLCVKIKVVTIVKNNVQLRYLRIPKKLRGGEAARGKSVGTGINVLFAGWMLVRELVPNLVTSSPKRELYYGTGHWEVCTSRTMHT